MKKISTIIICLTLIFVLGLLNNNAFASTSSKSNNDQNILQNVDALNPDIVREKLNGIKLTPENPTQTIMFDDGSKAVLKVIDLGSIPGNRYVKAASYNVSIGGIFQIKYSLAADWEVVDGVFDRVSLNDHWDDVVADLNVKITRYPTKAGSTSGQVIKVWGSVRGELATPVPLSKLTHFEFIGNNDGSCSISPISSYPNCPS